MNPLGLCVSPGTMPDQAEVDALNPAFLRSILIDVVDDLDRLLALGRPILLTLNNEADMVAGWAGWETALAYIAQRARGQLIGLTAANELDVYWSRNPADVPPAFAAELVNRAQTVLRPFGVPVGTTSLGGPLWPSYLTEMLKHCSPEFVAFNPYGWIFDGLDTKIESIRSVAPGLPIKLAELGCKIGDAGGEAGHALAVERAASIVAREGIDAAWFAYHDQNGAPWERGPDAFGLRRDDGSKRPAWDAFAALHDVVPEPTPEPEPEPDPEPVKELPKIMTIEECYRLRWQAIVPDAEYHHDFGLEAAWRAHPEWGSPVTKGEITLEDGRQARVFVNAIIAWTPDSGAEEVA